MTTPTLSGVHHVTFLVSDLEAAIAWYETVLGAQRLPRLDHHDEHGNCFAVLFLLPGVDTPVQVRRAAEVTTATAGTDAVIFSVPDRASLNRWAAHFDTHGVEHSPVMTARAGFSMTVTVPGGATLRFYTELGSDFNAVTITDTAVPE
ncbi:VOC family protein [Amycolatopsis sp. H20-H5]|uniref:VOC family protein n=1 Tax=Amycolatopsis sp. H20-H5 TaxID=3046309 RepID=UPI002DC0404C|nr:VOC family protein [Amycolatopsis sp. H20-H5]MEC3976960.1 VOC family protein [Amycolatopsis sp. H20-H5]